MNIRRAALIVGGAAALLCLVGALLDPVQFLRSYLWAYWFWLGVALGCGQLLMLQFLITGDWGVLIRRTLEAATRTLPLMFLLVIPLLLGLGALYPFAQPQAVAHSGALQHQRPYLNVPFFLVRMAVYFAVWWGVARLLNQWSLEQDRTGDPLLLRRCRRLSGPGIILYSLTISFASIDWAMSLEPDWFSTVYPAIYLVGQVLSALAVTIIAMRYLARRPPIRDMITPKYFHDLGNLLLTFTVLWAYIQTAQLIITWSGNLPREITWYLHRTRGGWTWVTALLVVCQFFLPFFVLLSRRAKLVPERLARIAMFILAVRMLDYFWLVEPAAHPVFHLDWLDLAAPLAVGGIWTALFVAQLEKRPLLPAYDPRLEEALEKS